MRKCFRRGITDDNDDNNIEIIDKVSDRDKMGEMIIQRNSI